MDVEDVVIAIDFSQASIDAARWTVRHLAPDADVTFVHAIEMPRTSSVIWDALPPREELLARSREQVEARFAELVSELDAGGARTEVLVGPAAEEIGILAREVGTDLVVTGDHQGRHEPWRLLGSTAEQLVATCRRPVLVARKPPAGPPRRVLVPVDESELAAKALGWACALGGRCGAEVIAYHAVTDWYYQQVLQTAGEENAQKVQERLAERARAWLDDFVAAHAAEGQEIRRKLGAGRPRRETMATIERLGIDLVVVGSHGVESLTGEPQKRLSRFLLAAAPCSVLVVC